MFCPRTTLSCPAEGCVASRGVTIYIHYIDCAVFVMQLVMTVFVSGFGTDISQITIEILCRRGSTTLFNFIYIAHLQTATRLAKVLHNKFDITHILKNTHVHNKIEFKKLK